LHAQTAALNALAALLRAGPPAAAARAAAEVRAAGVEEELQVMKTLIDNHPFKTAMLR
jgi:hypothetical protein